MTTKHSTAKGVNVVYVLRYNSGAYLGRTVGRTCLALALRFYSQHEAWAYLAEWAGTKPRGFFEMYSVVKVRCMKKEAPSLCGTCGAAVPAKSRRCKAKHPKQ